MNGLPQACPSLFSIKSPEKLTWHTGVSEIAS